MRRDMRPRNFVSSNVRSGSSLGIVLQTGHRSKLSCLVKLLHQVRGDALMGRHNEEEKYACASH